jgi:phenylalanyl-tRNA synthetase alpha chain
LPYTVPKLTDYAAAALDKAVEELLSALQRDSEDVSSEADWKTFRDRWMARKSGILTQINDLWLKAAPKEAKRQIGQRVNEIKAQVERVIDETLARLKSCTSTAALTSEQIDITLPGIRRPLGAEHPVIKTMNEMVAVFRNLGYSVEEGPEIETDYYNFESLNFPPNHPARDTQDTLFIANQDAKSLRERLLLRTHTSPVQIRTMEKLKPPIRIVIPGKVYRNDPPDASHSPMFHQIEGLAVDTNITFGDLKGTLDHAMKQMFGSNVKTHFRPSFFPFTEPSLEVDIQCRREKGEVRFGEGEDWMEILGCGMVHPNVLRNCGLDPDEYQGFAWGMGIDRIAMLKYGIADLRQLFDSDVRWLSHYGFKPLEVPTLAGGLSA